MSIKKKLILSNIAMILVPFAMFLLIELIAVCMMVYVFDRRLEGENLQLFTTIRVTGLLFAITASNGIITYLVSKSILQQVRMLTNGAKEIAQGNLAFSMKASSNDEIGELASIFEHMRSKLFEAKELQSKYEDNRTELIASISHDLRTPMTSIKGYAKGILDGVAQSPDKVEHYSRIIYMNACSMEKMINELFLYSKLDLHKVPMLLEEVDLRALLADYLEELGYTLEPNGGKVLFKHNPEESYVVMADRTQFRRVIENIVQNSLKYMDKQAKLIEVRLLAEPGQVKIEIEDNGIGISPEALPHIFDSFYRADAARNSATGGSGLGMAIAKQIIDAHDGRIWATSEIGSGTTISICLNTPGR
ncbi:HAMP domain-containing protein [Paenibacillus sp. UNCCL117]|uniref:sensor histidine kinase n=1 Tax=unclassified Paenibacillus TaxID=185978 RepID=UPI0008825C37|nr:MULTISPECIES: HAMP domain-containing sensor histidine kinase [unclassified Paenibacillus]SDE41518.1 HAMP domain-containing protein [Paenibacillus sp. cl123]SFW65497.1 HAMP domain-containing protein [Paenibacillus sp. UNCCL117]